MCGFVGFVGDGDIGVLKSMANLISHRGPDSNGFETLDSDVHLAHQRLSILDLSDAGHQPMWSHHKKLCIVFNGEIYNFEEIRSKLSRKWRGHSDTEVILEAFSEWGIDKTLRIMTGMFSFALYDLSRRILYLARDRFGEKPLYYGVQDGTFIFGSELKSFKAHPRFKGVINRQALKSFFRYSYVPAPLSIYDGIQKLEPGTYLEYYLDSKEIVKKKYWDFTLLPSGTGVLKFDDASRLLEEKLKNVIKQQMISDVSLGAFLSGGVDSSLVVALMRSVSAGAVKTFTIGFQERNYNEACFAKAVADHLRTDHHELYVTPSDALQVVPKLSHIYDEPFSDSSQIPMFLLSRLTKNFVTVSLSGDGGDEIFGGYNRYLVGSKIARSLSWAPLELRKWMSKKLVSISPETWDSFGRISGDKIHKLASVLGAKDRNDLYLKLVSHWDDFSSPVLGSDLSVNYDLDNSGTTFEERMMISDSLTYLPDDVLVKVDRASMAVSLETRVPFLDHHLAEFAKSLPMEFKISNGTGKLILRDILYRYVPKELIERPKMGFGVPLEHWLRRELKDWALELIDEKKIKDQNLLDYRKIKEKWDEHQSGKRNWQNHLWDVLMFQDWYENSLVR